MQENREIRFRAWDNKRQRMYCDGDYWLPALENAPDPSPANCYPIKVTSAGILFCQKISGDGEVGISLPDGKKIQAYMEWESDALSMFGLELMQFTELQDKTDKDIFEKDIISVGNFPSPCSVYWDSEKAAYYTTTLKGNIGPRLLGDYAWSGHNIATIIGNESENPELLK